MRSLTLSLLFASVFLVSRADAATLFDPNPSHPWNRLYAALFSETPADQYRGPQARVDWAKPDPRLSGPEYDSLLAALDKFLGSHAEKLVVSPVKRALLQSALWATFDQVSDPRGVERLPRIEIARRCAAIIQRISLSDAEIASLPDNYSIAVKQGGFPTDYDPEHRERAFLPPNLFDAQGPWVMLLTGLDSGPAAIQHVQAVQGRSVFYVFIRLPEDRAATLRYLHELAYFPQPYAWNEMYTPYPYARSPVKLSADLPQLPQGTEVALLRRMILPSARGELTVTPITESLQLRVYAVDPKTAQWGKAGNQVFHELRMAPTELFAGTNGLVAHQRFEGPDPLMDFEEPSTVVRGACSDCHAPIGVQSLHTYTHMMGPPRTTPWFEPAQQKYQDMDTLDWKRRDFTWGLLQGFFAAATAPAATSGK